MIDLALRPTWMMTDDELLAEAEAINRAADHDALRTPVTLARHLDPRYKLRPHLKLIGDALGNIRHGSGDRLMIFTPPQIGKTVTAAVWTPMWWLCHWPEDRIIIGSYNNNLAINRGRSVRKLVNEHGHRYGIALERGSQAVNDWELTSGGGVKSVGVGAGVTGSPGDLVIIDDPHKSRAEADSLLIRDGVYNWMSGDVNSRRQPSSPIVIIQTRWHEDDLGGRMIKEQGTVEEGGRWRVIHLPAFATSENDPLGRAIGDPLPHPKIRTRDKLTLTGHWEEKRATSSVRDWAALYQGDPKPTEGALLTDKVLGERRVKPADAPEAVIHAVAIDPSGGGRDTCGIVGGYRGTDNRVYWTHDASGVMPTADWARRACELAHELNAEMIIFEKNFGGDQPQLIIRTAWKAMADELGIPDLPPRIVSVHARKAKRLRAEPIAQQVIEDGVRWVGFEGDLTVLRREWTTWMPTDTASPGRIDASVYLSLALLVNTPADIGTPNPQAEQDAPPPLPTMPGTPPPVARPAGLPTGMPGAGGMPRLPTVPGLTRRR